MNAIIKDALLDMTLCDLNVQARVRQIKIRTSCRGTSCDVTPRFRVSLELADRGRRPSFVLRCRVHLILPNNHATPVFPCQPVTRMLEYSQLPRRVCQVPQL
jgi:hypothetical protein